MILTKKKKKKPELHAQISSALRQLWYWHDKARKTALARSNVKGVKGNLCQMCRQYTAKPEVDHITPVGRIPGSKYATEDDTWDMWIARLFCSPAGLRVLCKPCHLVVTNEGRKKEE